MADFDLDLDENAEQDQQRESHNIRLLREKADKVDKVSAENERLKRDLAFTRSGVDTESPLGRLFLKAYDGDPTEQAVKAAAIEYGVLAAPPPVVDDDEQRQLATIAQVAQGATPVNGSRITADDAAAWGTEKSMRFAKSHPAEWEALKRGEEINLTAF